MWIYRNVFRRFIEIEGLRDKFSLFYWIKLYLIELIKSGYCLWEEAITTRFTPVVWRMVRVSTASMNDLVCIILMTYIRHSKSKPGFSRFKLHKNCQQINFCWQEKFIFFQLSTWREAVHSLHDSSFFSIIYSYYLHQLQIESVSSKYHSYPGYQFHRA